MDKNEAILKAKNYIAVISNILTIESAWLFGSYASNSARDDNSDIDVGIFVKKIDEDYFLMVKKLFKARRSVDTRIEPHLFIDNTDISGFHEEVMRGIRVV